VDENQSFSQLKEVETLQWTVSAEEEGLRLDAWLSRRLSSFSRRERAELITEKQVLINRRPANKGTRVQTGDDIYVALSFPFSFTSPILITYCDNSIILVDKPTGLPSVGLRHVRTQTVAHFLLKQFPETARVSPRFLEGGLVHRLDNATSGLLLAARTPSAYLDLRKQFHERSVGKQYLALVEGAIKGQGQINLPLESTGPRGKYMRISPQGREALTRYEPARRFSHHTLVRITIETGVRHQIRAHFAALGHPLVGDIIYGAKTSKASRLCLHATMLTFKHPETGEKLCYTSSLPRDFCTEIERIKQC